MNLLQLRYLVQAAETGSFSRAATKLNVAQPALSRQIRLLEEDLGVRLFHRDGRGVEPTTAGKELVERANVLFVDLYEMRQAVMSHRGVVDGEVVIGILPLFGATVIPDLLLRAREKHPQVKVKLMVGMSDAILEWLISGRVDFGVVSTAVDTSKYLVSEEIARDDLHLISSAGTQNIKNGEPVSLTDALSTDLVIPTTSNGIRAVIDSCARQKDVDVNPTLEVDSIDIIKRLIPTGVGATILPKFAVAGEIEAGLFNSNQIIDPSIEYKVDLAFAIERPLTANASAIADILRQVASETIGQ